MTDQFDPAVVNQKSLELIEEFQKHYQEFTQIYRKDHTGDPDRTLVFESWAIQKIAGLQLSVMALAEKISER
jgi:hypothetical protein